MQNTLTNHRYLKPDYIPEMKLKQLQFETHSGKRFLNYVMEENVHLKNRLSEILKDRFDKNLLEEVDGFQNRFIKEDEVIGLLRHDIAETEKLLVVDNFEDRKVIKKIDKKLDTLRNNIITAEKQFGLLKSEFNNFLVENIL